MTVKKVFLLIVLFILSCILIFVGDHLQPMLNGNIVLSERGIPVLKLSSDQVLNRALDKEDITDEKAPDNKIISQESGINTFFKTHPSRLQYNKTIVFHNLRIDEVIQRAVRGNINNYLADYKNPCWFEGTTSRDGIRCIPYFYELGVAKSGSTALSRSLKKHPQIILFGKELNFWQRRGNALRGLNYYLWKIQNGSYAIYDQRNPDNGYHDIVMYDATPLLLSEGQPQHPDNINSQQEPIYTLAHTLYMLNPKTLLIVTMRDPSDRLFSDYHHFHRDEKIDIKDFHDWSKRGIDMMNKCLSQRTLRSCVFDQDLNDRINLKSDKYRVGVARFQFSMYYPFVKEYLSVFPRNQMYLIKAEEMYCDAGSMFTEIFNFLKLDEPPEDVLDSIVDSMDKGCANNAKWDESGESYRTLMTPKTKAMLDAFFAPYNQQLAELLQEDKWLFTRHRQT